MTGIRCYFKVTIYLAILINFIVVTIIEKYGFGISIQLNVNMFFMVIRQLYAH